jgi:hypothetical protein
MKPKGISQAASPPARFLRDYFENDVPTLRVGKIYNGLLTYSHLHAIWTERGIDEIKNPNERLRAEQIIGALKGKGLATSTLLPHDLLICVELPSKYFAVLLPQCVINGSVCTATFYQADSKPLAAANFDSGCSYCSQQSLISAFQCFNAGQRGLIEV